MLRSPWRFAQAVAVVFGAALLGSVAGDFAPPTAALVVAVLIALVAARLLIRTLRQRVVLDVGGFTVHGVLGSTTLVRETVADVVEGAAGGRRLFAFPQQVPVVVTEDDVRYELALLAGIVGRDGTNQRVNAQVAELRGHVGLPPAHIGGG